MELSKAKKLMEIEKECVLRQGTELCMRDQWGCQCCDLIQESSDIEEAYDTAIECIKFAQTITGFKTIEEFQKFIKAGDES